MHSQKIVEQIELKLLVYWAQYTCLANTSWITEICSSKYCNSHSFDKKISTAGSYLDFIYDIGDQILDFHGIFDSSELIFSSYLFIKTAKLERQRCI